MRIVVLTGMSGSGKSTAIHALEDSGYYAIDNLPIKLIDKLIELLSSTLGEIDKLALVVDARAAQLPRAAGLQGQSELEMLPRSLEVIRQSGHEVELVFLDASDTVLERRYSETRRRHPLAPDGTVPAGILAERTLLEPLRSAATRVLDTSTMSVHELRKQIQHLFSSDGVTPLSVTVLSFGFKHGVPHEADLVFDVRFLPNPHFVPELRPLTGENEGVARYVLDRDDTRAFLAHLQSMLAFLLPRYEAEGKAYLTIAIGCTGGRHRSVAVAREVAAWIEGQGRKVQIRHRDAGR
ncbi:RNase adapter RapZ [Myxococcota bacterium]|nr:RNase adapter RapZ [Myxococcota bacterium]